MGRLVVFVPITGQLEFCLANGCQMLGGHRERIFDIVSPLEDGPLDRAFAYESVTSFIDIVKIVPEVRVIAHTAPEPPPNAEREIVFLMVLTEVAVAMADEPMGYEEPRRERVDFAIFQQLPPERLRGHEGEGADRGGVAISGGAPRQPGVEIHVRFLAQRVIEVEIQTFPVAALPSPHDLCPGESAARARDVVGIGQDPGVAASTATAEGTGNVAAGGSNEDSVAPNRYAGRVGERAARRPRSSAVISIRVKDLLSAQNVHADRNVTLSNRAAPQGACVLRIASRAGGIIGAHLNLGAFKVTPEHDVDRAADGVPAVQCAGAVAQDLDALHRRDRQGVEIDFRVGKVAPVD